MENSTMKRPNYTTELCNTIYYFKNKLFRVYGRNPTVEEISAASGITVEKIFFTSLF